MQQHKVAGALLVAVAVCGLLAVVFESEADTVLQEGDVQSYAPGAHSAYAVIHDIQTDMIQEHNAGDVDSADNSQEAAKKALQTEEKDAHKGNVKAREAIADDEAKTGASVVSKMVKEIGNGIVEKSKTFARTVAERELKNEPSEPTTSESEAGDQTKLGKLKGMVATIRAAVVTAKENEQTQRKAAEDQAAAMREKVASKASQTKDDFETLKKNLAQYKAVTADESEAHAQTELEANKISALNEEIASSSEQHNRIQTRENSTVVSTKAKVSDEKHKLKETLNHYKGVLQGLKIKLHKVQNATDINAEMQARIMTEQAVVGKQKGKVEELSNDVTELRQELRKSHANIEEYTKSAVKRRHALGQARSAIAHMSSAAADLQKKASQHADVVAVKGTHGSTQNTTNKVVSRLVSAVTEASKNAKQDILKKVEKTAINEAEAAAERQSVTHLDHLPGLNHALDEAGSLVNTINVGATNSESTELFVQPSGLDEVLDSAAHTLSKLHEDAVRDEQVHHTELLAHVAHTLFEKAMRTGQKSDKAAAKAVMSKALRARNALGSKK